MTYVPAYVTDGFDPVEKGQCRCTRCGKTLSTNAFARKAHRGSSNCVQRTAEIRAGVAELIENRAPVGERPAPPTFFVCRTCKKERPWDRRCTKTEAGHQCNDCLLENLMERHRAFLEEFEDPTPTRRRVMRVRRKT